MTLLVEIVAVLAVLVLGYLLFLLLFEPGAKYRAPGKLHLLDDAERLRLLTSLLATPARTVRSAQVLTEGRGLYEAQLAAIRAARHSVHLEAYIFRPGRVAAALVEALAERSRSGVRVRVVVDAIGSFRTPRAYFAPLLAAGGRMYWYHPLRWHTFRRWNNRTHRNLLIVDGETAFVGGAGVADHWVHAEPAAWRDCALAVTGPIVADLQAVFAENWLECSGEMLLDRASFPGPVGEDAAPVRAGTCAAEPAPAIAIGSTPTAGLSTRARMTVQFLLASARERIDLCSPYFIPDLGIRRELVAARERGVRVRILTGGPYSDHGIVRRAGRRRYGALLEHGVEIFEYVPHMMHRKLLLVDGRWALVGSTNIDHRSFGLNDEVNLLVASPALYAVLLAIFEGDLAHSEALDLERWRRRPWGERLLAHLGRLIERHQ